jgi:hypothetical protein
MTSSPIFAVQYLENPYPEATPAAVRRRLCQACERLPISLVLLGWDLPPAIEEAVAQETTRQHAKLFRWQPLLTGDAHTDLPDEWATLGPTDYPIPGHGGLPEFSFICPNRSAVADFLLERVESAADSAMFQGLFLDRIRFPSPSNNPRRDLACFCSNCTRLAADAGLDLEYVRRYIQELPVEAILCSLLGKPDKNGSALEAFLDFRASSITRTVEIVAHQAQSHNLSIGLDCFSPTLTRMVGQDLSALDRTAEWIKIMTYPRVFGPAGIPFELLNLAEWITQHGWVEIEAMQLMREACGLPIPANKTDLSRTGLGSETIKIEIQNAYEKGVTHLLAGIAMVHMEKIHESSLKQIQDDLKASRNAEGLVISWDLWFTPFEILDSVREIWS